QYQTTGRPGCDARGARAESIPRTNSTRRGGSDRKRNPGQTQPRGDPRLIKRIGCAIKHPTNRSLEDFQAYWATHHAPLFSHTPELLRYVQHITLTEAYGGTPAPTHDGVSMFWYPDMESQNNAGGSPKLADIVTQRSADTYEWYVKSRRYGSPEEMTLQQ